MKKHFFFFFLLLPLLQFAQGFSALWEGHFSYFNIVDIAKSDTKIYAAAENAVFTYDINTEELQEISTINGLSGEAISTLHYSDAYQLLLIGYENGLMEIVLENNTNVLTVVDILDKVTIPPSNKGINHFNVLDNLVYIATDYGISVFDLERLEFGDTYFIGDQGSQLSVGQTAIFNNYIYAASRNGGIRRASLDNTNLIDFQNWEIIVNGDFLRVEALTNTLYAIRSDRVIYEIQETNIINLFQYNRPPLKMVGIEDRLVITTDNNVFIYDENFNQISQIDIDQNFNTSYTSAIIDGDVVFIGTTNFGILKTSISIQDNFQEIHPDGPLLNRPFSLEAFSNNLWVTFGEYSFFFNPYPLNSRGFSRYDGNSWLNIPYDDVLEAKCLNSIAVNPFNVNQVFVSSFFNGLLEVNEEVPTFLYDEENSGLESLFIPTNPTYVDIRVGPSQFDEEGLLWTVTSFIPKPLKSFNPSSGQWRSYDFTDIVPDQLGSNLGYRDLAIGRDGTKWVASYSFGVIGFSNEGGSDRIKNLSKDGNLPHEYVTSLAIDRRDQLWIGTIEGLRVLFNTSGFFDDDNVTASEIIISEDGVAKELLFKQLVSKIVVDGSNNKWIGTIGSGLFYFSSDGQQTIFHFTKDNSPLPSDNISELSLDESNGTLYIGTEKGLVSFKTGSSSTTEDFSESHAYPNPVRPGFDIVEEKVKIKDLPENVNIKITDIEGNLVAEAQSRTNQRYNGFNLEIDGGIAYWNGKNLANNIVASGVYLIMLSDLDSFETKVLKLMVVR
ncbi:ABC transporter substrate-binding protein [Hyunsoonleella flava]|uniref:ABC transporter substrate-binding protein n=1 Tax=Hyunsoonleella flava TaxID=2527939 RepID=A0A4Q9FA32_9FLAO|nr:two-component regulator propeller domain-containing protein [Hyunsoonleella flava]TBN00209.1 ABC transporter substrate-binding protein [Hyunsoonleella flava]